jgi:hypothetical protein
MDPGHGSQDLQTPVVGLRPSLMFVGQRGPGLLRHLGGGAGGLARSRRRGPPHRSAPARSGAAFAPTRLRDRSVQVSLAAGIVREGIEDSEGGGAEL